MTKYEWERQLKKGISGLPKAEQQRVLDYYNELFADKIDAGLREQYIISEFGNPYDVANKILVDYYNDGKDNPAVDEYIYSSSDEIDVAFDDAPEAPAVEAPKRKTFAERREEHKARHEARRDEHIDDVFPDSNESNTTSDKAKGNKGAKSASGLIAVLCVLVYFVLGACFNLWHPTWLIFLLIPCVITLIEAINKRNWHIFAYPVFVAFVFLLMGFYAHNWHPGWVIFLTIPVYYVLGNFITKNKDGKQTDKKQTNSKEQEPVREPQREEKQQNAKRNKRDSSTNVVAIIAKVLMTICLVWVSVVVWGFVISVLCGGVGLIVSGILSLVALVSAGFDALAIGLGLAQIGLGLICAFGMAALIKPCVNMCKAFIKTIKNSFDGKEKAQ